MKETDRNRRISPEDPASSSVYFDEIFKRFKIDRSSPEIMISSQWKQLVGENLSAGSYFESLENGVLNVVCKNSSQAALFRMNKTEVLKNIRSVFPELYINKINIRVKLA